VLAALAVLLPGCLEVETTVRVNSDGTIHRTVEITGDSTALAEGSYPLALHGPWSMNLQREDPRKFHLKAERTFASADELNDAIGGEPGRTIQLRARLERTFLWFTTTFRYEETFVRFYPFDAVPITDYVSDREIDLYLRHEMEEEPYQTPGDSLALDDASDRFEEWEKRSRFEAFFAELLRGAERAGTPELTTERLAGAKEELYRRCFGDGEPTRAGQLIESAGAVLGTRSVQRAVEANRDGFDAFDRKMSFLEDVATTGFTTRVEMPGLITDTNAPALEGTTVSWSDFKAYCYVRDYTMWVESRMINWWAIILTGVVVLALVGLFSLFAVRRKPLAARA
jgi:hypothetical protein